MSSNEALDEIRALIIKLRQSKGEGDFANNAHDLADKVEELDLSLSQEDGLLPTQWSI